MAAPTTVGSQPACTLLVGDAGHLDLPDGDEHGPGCGPAGCRHPSLVVTSPPYCLGIADRGYVDYTDYAAYLAEARRWAAELHRVLQPNGRLALNVPIDITRCGRQPVAADWLVILREVGFRYRCSVVWQEGNVSKSTARGSVDSPSAINLICPVEIVQIVHKGAWNLERSERSDLGHGEWLEWTLGAWPFAGEHRRRVGYAAAFPEELPRRLIKLLSFPGDLVLDPFVGSGTTALVASELGRRCHGYDLNPAAIELARRRLAAAARNDGA